MIDDSICFGEMEWKGVAPDAAQPWLCIADLEKERSYMAVFNNDKVKRIDHEQGMGFFTSFS